MLCGHTHNGQIVPFNRLVKRYFPRIAGRYEAGATVLYVSPGTGTWGPMMRLGSSNEITVFELSPAPAGTRIMIRSGGRHFVGVHFQVQGLSAGGRGVFDGMGGGNRDGHSPPEPPAPLAGPPARQPPG